MPPTSRFILFIRCNKNPSFLEEKSKNRREVYYDIKNDKLHLLPVRVRQDVGDYILTSSTSSSYILSYIHTVRLVHLPMSTHGDKKCTSFT